MSENPDKEWVVRDPGSLGQVIGFYRRKAAMDQETLASAAGMNRQYLSDLETGKATEQTARIFRVLRRLGLEVVIRPVRRRG